MPLPTADALIDAYLRELARCPVCDGSGRTTFGRDTTVGPMMTGAGSPASQDRRYVPAGTEASCPRCGGDDPLTSGVGDPEFVAWHCVVGERDSLCQGDRKQHEERRSVHADCGWRIVLPLSESPTG
jgi:hypothetical protein